MGTTHLKHAQANEFPFIGVWCTVSRSHWSVKPESNQPSLVQLQPLRPIKSMKFKLPTALRTAW